MKQCLFFFEVLVFFFTTAEMAFVTFFIDVPKTVEQLCGILHMYFGVAPLVIASRSDSQFTKALTQPVCILEFHILCLFLPFCV